jgi:hypothetical protein
MFKDGAVRFPKHASFMLQVEKELLSYPYGETDDIVDSTVWLTSSPERKSCLRYLRAERFSCRSPLHDCRISRLNCSPSRSHGTTIRSAALAKPLSETVSSYDLGDC